MAYDSHSPITTSRSLEWPIGHRLYTTTRQVAGETPVPAVGSLMSAVLGSTSPYASHVVISSSEGPRGSNSQRTHSIQHMLVPTGISTRYRSVAYTFPAVYPKPGSAFFPGGSNARARVVLGRENWEFTRNPAVAPTNWLADPVVIGVPSGGSTLDPTTGPFEVRSYIAEASSQVFLDGDNIAGRVGEYLAMQFVTQDTLNDAIEINAPGDLSYPIPESVPSRSLYVGWVTAKTWIMVSRTIVDWYGDILARRTVFVIAQ